MIKIILAISLLLISGCAAYFPDELKAASAGRSASYQLGAQDGCRHGWMENSKKNVGLHKSDVEYREGWDKAYVFCANEDEKYASIMWRSSDSLNFNETNNREIDRNTDKWTYGQVKK